MADERHEYVTLAGISDPVNPGRLAYAEGQPIHAQVVADWGLAVGEQVQALRPEQMAEPAGNATRDEWLRYRLATDPDRRDEFDSMGRDQLRDFDPKPAKAAGQAEAPPSDDDAKAKTPTKRAGTKAKADESGE